MLIFVGSVGFLIFAGAVGATSLNVGSVGAGWPTHFWIYGFETFAFAFALEFAELFADVPAALLEPAELAITPSDALITEYPCAANVE